MALLKRATKKLNDAGFPTLRVKRGAYGCYVEDARFVRQSWHLVCRTADDAVSEVLERGKLPIELPA